MNFSNVLLIFRKDWLEIGRNWQVLVPVIVVPIVFSMALPFVVANYPDKSLALGPLQAIISGAPGGINRQLSGFDGQQFTFYAVSVLFFAPFFLVVPLVASSVIASDSFAGEKERRTIEALLATPISDSEMFLGKMLVSFAAAMLATLGSAFCYIVVVDLLGAGLFGGRLILPTVSWIMLIFLLAPTVSLASIGLTVAISSRVKGFREAQQINAVLIVPILILVFAEVWVAVILGPGVIGLLVVAFVAADALMFYIGVRLFRREEILSRLG